MQSSSIIRNTSALFIAHLIGRILTFVLIIILPRYLEGGFNDMGRYLTALWLTNLLATLTELGLYTPLIREVAADKSKASRIISNALAIRLALCLFVFVIIVLLARVTYSSDMAPLIYILGVSEIMGALTQLLCRIFRAFERMGFEALSLVLERSLVFFLGLWVVIRGYGIISFCVVVLIASILNFALTFSITFWKFSRPSFRLLNMKLWGYLLKQAIPFAFGDALSTIYLRIDGLMLKYIMRERGNLSMGWYGTGFNFVMSLTIIPGAFMGAVFPVMSRMLHSSATAMGFLYTKSLKLMLIMALPIAVGVAFIADKIVLILYPIKHFGPQDQEALSRILGLLIWAGALTFLNFVLITVFRAANKRRAFMTIMTLSVSANIISNLILIPRYQHLGPAISMIVSESILFICGLCYAHRYVCKLNEFGFIFKSVFASGIIAVILFAWKHWARLSENIPVPLVIILAIITYLAVIIALKGITREDIAMARGHYPER